MRQNFRLVLIYVALAIHIGGLVLAIKGLRPLVENVNPSLLGENWYWQFRWGLIALVVAYLFKEIVKSLKPAYDVDFTRFDQIKSRLNTVHERVYKLASRSDEVHREANLWTRDRTIQELNEIDRLIRNEPLNRL